MAHLVFSSVSQLSSVWFSSSSRQLFSIIIITTAGTMLHFSPITSDALEEVIQQLSSSTYSLDPVPIKTCIPLSVTWQTEHCKQFFTIRSLPLFPRAYNYYTNIPFLSRIVEKVFYKQLHAYPSLRLMCINPASALTKALKQLI